MLVSINNFFYFLFAFLNIIEFWDLTIVFFCRGLYWFLCRSFFIWFLKPVLTCKFHFVLSKTWTFWNMTWFLGFASRKNTLILFCLLFNRFNMLLFRLSNGIYHFTSVFINIYICYRLRYNLILIFLIIHLV